MRAYVYVLVLDFVTKKKKKMSDRLEGYDLSKFKQNISLSTEHCLNYVKQDCIDGDNIAFTVNIPNEHLRSWRDLREEGGLLCQFSYVEILNAMIDEYGVKIKEDCARIDGLLQRSSFLLAMDFAMFVSLLLWRKPHTAARAQIPPFCPEFLAMNRSVLKQ